MVGWIAAGAICAITCFASKAGHNKQVPLLGALAAGAVFWTCKFLRISRLNDATSSHKLEKLESEVPCDLNSSPELVSKPLCSEVLLVQKDSVVTAEESDSGVGVDEDLETHSGQFTSASDDSNRIVLEDYSKNKEMSTFDSFVEHKVSLPEVSESVPTLIYRSSNKDQGQDEVVDNSIKAHLLDISPHIKRVILEYQVESEETISTFISLLQSESRKDIAGESELSINPTTSGNTFSDIKEAGLSDFTSSFKNENITQLEDETNTHNTSEEYPFPMKFSITNTDFHQDEKLDPPSSVWKFLNTDDSEIGENNDLKGVLRVSIPSDIGLDDALTLSGATCSSKSSFPSPNHAAVNPNTLEGITLDIQINSWDEVASEIPPPRVEVATESADGSFPRVPRKGIPMAPSSPKLDDAEMQMLSPVECLTKPKAEETLGNHNVPASFLGAPLPAFGGSQETVSHSQAELVWDTAASVPTYDGDQKFPCSLATTEEMSACGISAIPHPICSSSAMEEKLEGEVPLDTHIDSYELAGKDDEERYTSSPILENRSAGNSFLKEVSFRYGADGDSDIFDILNSKNCSAPEKNVLLEALDEDIDYSWLVAPKNPKRSASITSAKSLRQESFKESFYNACAEFDLRGQKAISPSSLASGDVGETTSFRTARSLNSPNAFFSARSDQIQAEMSVPKCLASSFVDDAEWSSTSTNDHVRRLSNELTPINASKVIDSTGNGGISEIIEAMKSTRRSYSLGARAETDYIGKSLIRGNFDPINTTRSCSDRTSGEIDFTGNAQSSGGFADIAQKSYSHKAITYDKYLSDPKLSPQMRLQVLRAKATLERYYESERIVVAVPRPSIELGKSEILPPKGTV